MVSDPLLLFRRAPKGLDRARLRAFAQTLRDRVSHGLPFCAMLTGDSAVHDLNRHFLGIDSPTDVLSFPARDTSDSLGDIAISWQRARAQAAAFGHPIETEIEILLLHGLLHLLGHDHETGNGRMRRLETRWRKALGLPPGLIERANSKPGRPPR
ncbi:MAG: rRNA maturation RNase YbeY [Candidatus Solibacter sp.]|nr:rRNA maturation RNase YbeY [Candidatus Solibacter sp.]